MRKISDELACFVVSLKEVKKVWTFSIGATEEKSGSQITFSRKNKRGGR